MDAQTANALDRWLTTPPDEPDEIEVDTSIPKDWQGYEINKRNKVYEVTFSAFETKQIGERKTMIKYQKTLIAIDENNSLEDMVDEFDIDEMSIQVYKAEDWMVGQEWK